MRNINIMLIPSTCEQIRTYRLGAMGCARAQRGACRGHLTRVGGCRWLSANHLNVNGISAMRPPSERPRVHRTPTLLPGSAGTVARLARLPTSPSLVVRSRSGRVQRPESVPLPDIPKSNYPGRREELSVFNF